MAQSVFFDFLKRAAHRPIDCEVINLTATFEIWAAALIHSLKWALHLSPGRSAANWKVRNQVHVFPTATSLRACHALHFSHRPLTSPASPWKCDKSAAAGEPPSTSSRRPTLRLGTWSRWFRWNSNTDLRETTQESYVLDCCILCVITRILRRSLDMVRQRRQVYHLVFCFLI